MTDCFKNKANEVFMNESLNHCLTRVVEKMQINSITKQLSALFGDFLWNDFHLRYLTKQTILYIIFNTALNSCLLNY